MTDDEDHALQDLDLEAYRVPAAPAGLADRVIARMQATDEAIAMSTAIRQKHVRRWLYGAGLATVLAAAVVMLLVAKQEPAVVERTDGALVAKSPEHLVLEGVTANLDPGADVTWQRGGAAVHVAQRAGTATWAVPATRHLSVDVGAAVASIDATNATFRVEARMNLSDARTIGVTAATAAAVALVTVVVYEGHVKVSGAGQTVILNPGTTTTIEPGKAPVETKNIAGTPMTPTAPAVPAIRDASADVWITPGGKAFIHDAKHPTRVGIITACAHSSEITWSTPGGDGPNGMREWKAPVANLDSGVFSYEVRCDGASERSASGILVTLGLSTSKRMNLLFIDKVHQSSFDRQAWPEQWQIDGHAIADVSVTASGVPVELKDGHFSVMMSEPEHLPPLVLRAEHATQGVHYYVNRPHDAAADSDDNGLKAEVVISPGESAVIHDALGKTNVALSGVCDHAGSLAWSTSSSSSSSISTVELTKTVTLASGSWTYTVKCDDAPTTFTGTVSLIDDGSGPNLMQIDVPKDGDIWTPEIRLSGHIDQNVNVTLRDTPLREDLSTSESFSLTTTRPSQGAPLVLRASHPSRGIHFYLRRRGGDTSTVRREKQRVESAVACDASQLQNAGTDAESRGDHVAALASLEKALRCKPEMHTIQLAFMSACNGGNLAAARKYWKQLTPEAQNILGPIAYRAHFERTQLDQ